MFPITEEYIEREYTIAGNHLMLTSEHTAREIEQKARKVVGMLKRGDVYKRQDVYRVLTVYIGDDITKEDAIKVVENLVITENDTMIETAGLYTWSEMVSPDVYKRQGLCEAP